MSNTVRALGIAPYENLREQLLSQARNNPDIELTVFVGDLQQGVDLARKNYYNDYDVIISRGGTAELLRRQLDIPVIDIPILPFDIMRAMKLAECVSNHYAIVGFPNVTGSASTICQMMQIEIDIYTIHKQDNIELTLREIYQKGIHAIICDMASYTEAMRMGMDVVLITSGTESIQSAFDDAVDLIKNYHSLREENRFLRSLIWNQLNHTVVFNEKGELFLSTLDNNAQPIMEFLQEEQSHTDTEDKQYLLKQLHNKLYSIRAKREEVGEHRYTTFFFSESRTALSDIRRGVRYVNCREAEREYRNSLYGIGCLLRTLQDEIDRINKTELPLIICGEDGTLKEQAVNYIYIQSVRRDRPLVVVDCFMLNESAWEYLISHRDSPLSQNGCTIFIKNVDVLPDEKRVQLIVSILSAGVSKRNRMVFSCVCPPQKKTTPAATEFLERLCGTSLFLPPMRQRSAQIPAIVNIYLSHLNTVQARQIMGLESEAMLLLQRFDWPHNYTQFQRILKELAATANGLYITVAAVNDVIEREKTQGTFDIRAEDTISPINLNQTLQQINREIVSRVLIEEKGNQSKAAKRLGIGRTTLWRMINDNKT